MGNLGVNDIKNHRYLATVSFSNMLSKKITAPFLPVVKKEDDTSNFVTIDDSNSEAKPVSSHNDPFLQWGWYDSIPILLLLLEYIMGCELAALASFPIRQLEEE